MSKPTAIERANELGYSVDVIESSGEIVGADKPGPYTRVVLIRAPFVALAKGHSTTATNKAIREALAKAGHE